MKDDLAIHEHAGHPAAQGCAPDRFMAVACGR